MISLSHLGIDALNAMQQDTAAAYRRSGDLLLLSPTGSGKTLAYLLPLLESLDSASSEVQAVVIVPSRELAMQTCKVVRDMKTEVRALPLYGGRPAMDEHRQLQSVRPQLVVGTPGRLLDHLQKGNFMSNSVRTLIIDEFDKCLELGFREEMSAVMAHLPRVDKRMLLSATDDISISQYLTSYTRLDFLSDSDNGERTSELFVKSLEKDKLGTLSSLLMSLGAESSLVFVGFRESVERVADYLRRQGFCAAAMHGGMEQRDRERQLFRFVSGSCNILVATDLASRGLDIDGLQNVIHYHLPLTDEVRTHRNGRTARWDRLGRIFYLVGPEEQPPLDVQETSFPVAHQGEHAPLPLWETLYIGKGRKDKLSRGDIAGFLMKIGGLQREEVGLIDVRDHQSYAAVRRNVVHNLIKRLAGQKIKGMKTIVQVASLA